MGNSFSFNHAPLTKKLNVVVQGVMSNNYISQETCMSDYHILLGKELKTLSKLNVKTLKDHVFFVPDAIAAHSKSDMMTKKELCEKVSSHYASAIDAIKVIKRVYDTEGEGKDSFWATVRDNNVITDASGKKLVEIRFCDKTSGKSKVDLAKAIPGMGEYVGILKDTERNIFLNQVHVLLLNFGNSDISEMSSLQSMLSCGDELMTPAEYANLYMSKSQLRSAADCRRYKELAHVSDKTLLVGAEASERLPGKHSKKDSTCVRVKSVQLSILDPKERTKIHRMYTLMCKRSAANLATVKDLLNDLVSGSPTSGYEIKHMTDEKLTAIVLKIKKEILRYYIGILLDFNALTLAVKKIK